MRRAAALGFLALCAACVASPSSQPTDIPGGLDETPVPGASGVSVVTLSAATFPVRGPYGEVLEAVAVPAGDYPVRRVAADRVRVPVSPRIEMTAAGEVTVPSPPIYQTLPTLRVGGTDEKLVAVIVARTFCGQPLPGPEELYRWGDEAVMRAEETGEWQFEGLC